MLYDLFIHLFVYLFIFQIPIEEPYLFIYLFIHLFICLFIYLLIDVPDTCRGTLIPLVCKFCQQALKTEDITLPVVAKQIGRFVHGFSGKRPNTCIYKRHTL